MSYLIDTHCHLHDRQFFSEEQAEEILKHAAEGNVRKIVCIGTDPEDSMAARDFAAAHPGVYWTYGVHPEEWETVAKMASLGPRPSGPSPWADGAYPRAAALRSPSSKPFSTTSPIAIGEVGLDYHSDGYNREAQIHLFEEMLQLALDNDLPLSFHVRNAFSDFFAVVENFPGVRGVVHSFTDSKKTLRKILENTDFYVGVNGLATYSTLPTPPLERILLETDAPFLTPAPFRGKINESGYIPVIAQWLSEKLGVEFETIEKETTKNAEQLFKFDSAVIR
ncbi:TatD family hydrolase [Candidatus Saccharibacteria bacterium]|nr:TatD family hydrolase [Candidatus Saccharibacteria bacterium]